MRKQIKRVVTSVVALSTLMTFGFTGLATAGSGTDTCVWTGGGSDTNWSTVANWSNCGSAAPVSGDSITFDNTSASADIDTTNDIAGLTLNKITFTGTGTVGSFYIGGTSISLSGGIENTTSQSAYVRDTMIITLTANQAISGRLSGYQNSGNFPKIVIGNHTLTLSGETAGFVFEGGGTVKVDSTLSITALNPNFSGTLHVGSGGSLNLYLSSGSIGTAEVVVDSGGTLQITSSEPNATFANDISIAGDGEGYKLGALVSCLSKAGPMSSCTAMDTNLTLSGVVTLTGDTFFGNGAYGGDDTMPEQKATITMTGTLITNGFNLAPISNSNTEITGEAYAAAGFATEAPDTGFGLVANSPAQTLVITSLLAGAIFFISRRVFARAGVRN